MKILAVALQKGGVGKTTCTVNIGFALARKGLKVLMIDLDPQASLSDYFFPRLSDDETPFDETVLDLFMKEKYIKPVNITQDIDLIPSESDLSSAELSLPGTFNPQMILNSILKSPLYQEYDIVILDCPPSLSIMTINALTSAQRMLVTAQTDLLVARTIKLILSTAEKVRERQLNPNLKVWKILATKYDRRIKHDQDVFKGYSDRFATIFYPEPVMQRATYKDAAAAKTDVAQFDKEQGAFWDRLTDKLLQDWEA